MNVFKVCERRRVRDGFKHITTRSSQPTCRLERFESPMALRQPSTTLKSHAQHKSGFVFVFSAFDFCVSTVAPTCSGSFAPVDRHTHKRGHGRMTTCYILCHRVCSFFHRTARAPHKDLIAHSRIANLSGPCMMAMSCKVGPCCPHTSRFVPVKPSQSPTRSKNLVSPYGSAHGASVPRGEIETKSMSNWYMNIR